VTGFSVGNLKVETADGKSFTLLEPFLFVRPNGEVIPVPAGAKSDGASTPSALWITLPPFGAYWRAAFLHDHLYRETMLPMESLGVRWDDLNTLYEGVHLFGWSSFKEDRDQVKKELTA
jgi:hypothetical protein